MKNFLTKSRYILITAGLVCAGIVAVTQINNRKISTMKAAAEQRTADATEVPTQDDPWQELDKLVNSYYAEEGMLYEGTVKAIDASAEEEKVLEELPMTYTLLGDAFHYRLGTSEVVSKKDLLLAIDHRGKTITYLPRSFSPEASGQVFDLGRFRALLEGQQAQAAVSLAGDLKILTIDGLQDPSIQGYRIYYRPDNYQVKKMEIGMNRLAPLEEVEVTDAENDPSSGAEDLEIYTYFLEVNYTNVQRLGLKREAFRPEEKFVLIQNDSIQLTPSFKNYTLFNEGE